MFIFLSFSLSLSYLATQRLQADDDRVEILTLPEIDTLECLLSGYTKVLGTLQESRNVLHALEGHFTLVDLLNAAGLQCVGQFAQDHTILEHLKEVFRIARCVNRLRRNSLNPFQGLLCELLAVL